MTTLDTKIETYYLLLEQKKSLETRLDTLNKQIKEAILGIGRTIEPGDTFDYAASGYEAHVQVKQGRPKVDDEHLLDLLMQKGLYNTCTKTVPDHDLVEQAFIEGKITDTDLRSINQGSDITIALKVDRREDSLLKGKESAQDGW